MPRIAGIKTGETYPQSRGGGGFSLGTMLLLYGGGATASVPAVEYGANRVTGYNTFIQDDILEEGALLVRPAGYALGTLSMKRVITGVAGPIIGDTDIIFELLQSTDNGATWVNPAGGTAISLTFAPNETGDKSVVVGRFVPGNALIAIRATYPANYDPQGQEENILFAIEVAA